MVNELENLIGYQFKDKSLIKRALTHSSYANEFGNKFLSYERLEFLGDSILGLVTSEYIYKNFPRLPEGELTKLKSVYLDSSCVFLINCLTAFTALSYESNLAHLAVMSVQPGIFMHSGGIVYGSIGVIK